jgi:5'-methylthioinosine phosphorylase
MTGIAILGGSGLDRLQGIDIERTETLDTPYGTPSDVLTIGHLAGVRIVFLPRHGAAHTIPPHRINYRANLWALRQLGCDRVISVCAVGSIHTDIQPADIIIPHQIIDYTRSREHTLYDEDLDEVVHIDFTEPYCEALRTLLIQAAETVGVSVHSSATYGATQGPRLETAAEINRMERDGCDIVGMTGMPEASIARELGLCYATIAVSANNAAGRHSGPLEMEGILKNVAQGMDAVRLILVEVLKKAGR